MYIAQITNTAELIVCYLANCNHAAVFSLVIKAPLKQDVVEVCQLELKSCLID